MKSDFGGSEIEFERNMVINGGQSNQYQSIPPGNLNHVKNCTIVAKSAGENLQGRAPCPNATADNYAADKSAAPTPTPCNVTTWDQVTQRFPFYLFNTGYSPLNYSGKPASQG